MNLKQRCDRDTILKHIFKSHLRDKPIYDELTKSKTLDNSIQFENAMDTAILTAIRLGCIYSNNNKTFRYGSKPIMSLKNKKVLKKLLVLNTILTVAWFTAIE